MIDKSILWSAGVIIVTFCICFAVLTLSKPEFLSYKNMKGKKVINYRKTSLISMLISISLGIAVFIFLFSKDNKTNTGLDFDSITKPSTPKLFRKEQLSLKPQDSWISPL